MRASASSPSRFKASHKVGAALTLCYLVAWLDRMAISMTLPSIQNELHLGPTQSGWVVSAFFLGYAMFQIPGGALADKFGPRRVILAALLWWSIFTAITGRMTTLVGMLVARFLFGIGEGIFPAAVWKVLSGWFTRKNRSTANALVLSSVALGPALTPWVLMPLLSNFGWRSCFVVLGVAGAFCLLVAGLSVFDTIHQGKNVPAEELEAFDAAARSEASRSERSLEPESLKSLLKVPIVWALFFVALVANIGMYGWLTWLPTYLLKVKGLDLKGMTLNASLPFFFGAIGCVWGGWISDRYFRGRRKLLVLGCLTLGGSCLYLFTRVEDPVTYLAVQCVAGFLLFMGTAAVWALPMVLLPAKLMGSGSGFINTGGQIGGILSGVLIGNYIHYRGDNYAAGFEMMLGALAAASLIVLLAIREQPPVPATAPDASPVPS